MSCGFSPVGYQTLVTRLSWGSCGCRLVTVACVNPNGVASADGWNSPPRDGSRAPRKRRRRARCHDRRGRWTAGHGGLGGIEGDEIVLATLPDQRKLRNLRRDPRIALSVPSTTTNEWGLLEYLAVYGTAEVTEGAVPPRSSSVSHTRTSARTLSSRTCPIPRRDSSQGSRPNALAASGRGTRHAARHRRFHHGSSRIGRTITTTGRARPPTPPEGASIPQRGRGDGVRRTWCREPARQARTVRNRREACR